MERKGIEEIFLCMGKLLGRRVAGLMRCSRSIVWGGHMEIAKVHKGRSIVQMTHKMR